MRRQRWVHFSGMARRETTVKIRRRAAEAGTSLSESRGRMARRMELCAYFAQGSPACISRVFVAEVFWYGRGVKRAAAGQPERRRNDGRAGGYGDRL